MNELKVFTIYDEKAQAFITPFHLPTGAMALRTFADCVNSKEHQFGQHPADYTLYEIASFDCEHGKMVPYQNAIHLAKGDQLVKHEPLDEDQLKIELSIGDDEAEQPAANGADNV